MPEVKDPIKILEEEATIFFNRYVAAADAKDNEDRYWNKKLFNEIAYIASAVWGLKASVNVVDGTPEVKFSEK